MKTIKELISKLEEKHSKILVEYNDFNSLYNQDNPEFLSFYRTRMKDILEIINDLKEIEDSSKVNIID